jgi:hypothetical protein
LATTCSARSDAMIRGPEELFSFVDVGGKKGQRQEWSND